MIKFVTYLNMAIVVFMTVAYFYQGVYTAVGLLKRRAKPEPEPSKMHRFAAVISARNEAGVIGELVKSLKAQDYPSDLFDVYVLADNCTDATAARAREAGALVYERWNHELVGKGYALDYVFKKINAAREGLEPYDAFFIFDADNVVDSQFVREMNKTFDRGDYDVITCYRNSKNFGANWISAGYSIWFLREARFLNFPRSVMGTSCAVSGTGFLVSNRILEENGGWPFHLLTEDIQFSVNCAVTGHKIGYCDRAIVYDEQPTSFSQSWNQRMRWSKGFYQVDAKYLPRLLEGAVSHKGSRFSCYDMMMTVAPAMLLTIFSVIFNVLIAFACLTQPYYIAYRVLRVTGHFLRMALTNYYIGLFLYACLTVASEWKQIHATSFDKVRHIVLFPIFMATYIPIALIALVSKVEWKPIQHFSTEAIELKRS